MKENVEQLRRENPEFEYHIYDDAMCRKFIKTHFDEDVVFAFDKLKPGAYKADLWRYCALYIHGGIYIDIKMKCVNGFRLVQLTDKEYWVKDCSPAGIYQAIMVCLPNNESLYRAIQEIVDSCKRDVYFPDSLALTGPNMLVKHVEAECNPDYEMKNVVWKGVLFKGGAAITSYDEYRREYGRQHYHWMCGVCDVYNYSTLKSIKTLDLTRTMERNGTTFFTCTPTIMKTTEGFVINQRWVNYRYKRDGSKEAIPNQWNTLNSRLFLDVSLQQVGHETFLVESETSLRSRAVGLEDIRLYEHEGSTHFIANKMARIHYGVYGTKLNPTCVPSTQPEKNWSFVEFDDELCVVHSWYPLKIGRLVEDKLDIFHTDEDMPAFFKNARGSTPGVKWGGEIWFVLHKAYHYKMKVYNYQHFIAVFDLEMKLKRYSDTFKFAGEKVEYCNGLAMHNDNLYISYSTLDSNSFIGVYSKKRVERLLKRA